MKMSIKKRKDSTYDYIQIYHLKNHFQKQPMGIFLYPSKRARKHSTEGQIMNIFSLLAKNFCYNSAIVALKLLQTIYKQMGMDMFQ